MNQEIIRLEHTLTEITLEIEELELKREHIKLDLKKIELRERYDRFSLLSKRNGIVNDERVRNFMSSIEFEIDECLTLTDFDSINIRLFNFVNKLEKQVRIKYVEDIVEIYRLLYVYVLDKLSENTEMFILFDRSPILIKDNVIKHLRCQLSDFDWNVNYRNTEKELLYNLINNGSSSINFQFREKRKD